MSAEPTIEIHRFVAAAALTGVTPDGDSSEDTIRRGRIRRWGGTAPCTVGGDFPADANNGYRLLSVLWTLGATTGTVTVYLIDDMAVEYPVGALVANSGMIAFRNDGVIVPPGWSIKVKTSGAAGAGSVQIHKAIGWPQGTLEWAGELGQENRVTPKPTW